MAAWLHGTTAGFLLANWLKRRRHWDAGPAFQASAAKIISVGEAGAAASLRDDGLRLARMVFGDSPTPKQVAEAEAVIWLYLHDRCLVEQVGLLDTRGEPQIAGFRASLIRALAVSAIGILLDRARAPLAPVEPYPAPVQLLDAVWHRVVPRRSRQPWRIAPPDRPEPDPGAETGDGGAGTPSA